MASRGNVESLAKRSTRGPSGAGIGRQRALITPDRACLWPIYIKSEIPFAAPGTLGRSLNGGLAGGKLLQTMVVVRSLLVAAHCLGDCAMQVAQTSLPRVLAAHRAAACHGVACHGHYRWNATCHVADNHAGLLPEVALHRRSQRKLPFAAADV
ncbi:hypothetical protein Vafri_16925 [Volvox africanus]|uniref:Uncharacterized protein n=1 Tax=Volvox africanus TaxID=51714 RepID=A0A8J4BJX5_9CHLO|nr:hypothetical protein Vafri_16925 [Volvox africanus]